MWHKFTFWNLTWAGLSRTLKPQPTNAWAFSPTTWWQTQRVVGCLFIWCFSDYFKPSPRRKDFWQTYHFWLYQTSKMIGFAAWAIYRPTSLPLHKLRSWLYHHDQFLTTEDAWLTGCEAYNSKTSECLEEGLWMQHVVKCVRRKRKESWHAT